MANNLTDVLADIYNRADREGRWPELLRIALVAMVPKDGALWEAELRSIGLLPCIYKNMDVSEETACERMGGQHAWAPCSVPR